MIDYIKLDYSLSYLQNYKYIFQEVKKAKESLKAALEDFSDGEDESDENGEESGLFKKREISGQEKGKC